MKTKFLILLASLIAAGAASALAMGDKPKQDSACMNSENIRLKVKDVVFDLPRKQVLHITYAQDNPNYMPSTPARRLCQYAADAPVEVLGFDLKIHPLKEYHLKAGNRDCADIGMTGSIGNTGFNTYLGEIPDKISEIILRAQCEKTRNHDACQGGYRYRGLNMSFHYYKSCYPSETWQQTTQGITKYLDQFVVKGE